MSDFYDMDYPNDEDSDEDGDDENGVQWCDTAS